MNIEKIKKYILDNTVYENIIYCFKSEEMRNLIKPNVIQGDPTSIFKTELLIDENSLTHKNSPIYIYGEYIKMSREMTQTPLRIKGKLKTKRSVSDFTKQVKVFFCAKEVKFIPSGREDIDVRNINGRPFILQVIEPKANLKFDTLELCLYPEIDVINVKHVTKKIKENILSNETEGKKIYKAYIVSEKKILIKQHYDLSQKTPLRVLHRRANLLRKKEIEILNYDEFKNSKESNLKVYKYDFRTDVCSEYPLSDDETLESHQYDDRFYYIIEIKASAGAYIKEFVNGDFGRTKPSLSEDGNYADLIELDVISVEKKSIDTDTIISSISLKKTFN